MTEKILTDGSVDNSSFYAPKKGKEVKVDTHFQKKQNKKRKEEQKKKLLEERNIKFKKDAISGVEKIEESERAINKFKQRKASSEELKKARERVLRSVRTPFSYYYYSSINVSNVAVFTNICQCLNDKFIGRVYQFQYFAVAEQSDRIFQVNNLLITQAIGIALLHPNNKFVVQISPKYLENKERFIELDFLLGNIPSNLVVAFDARTLIVSGEKGKTNLQTLIDKYHFDILIDSPETERLSLLFDYPIKYLRIDNRYFLARSENQKVFIKFLLDFCKKKNIDLCVKNIESKQDKEWMQANGIKYLEGNFMQLPKKVVSAAISCE